jgi:hypothetical protein
MVKLHQSNNSDVPLHLQVLPRGEGTAQQCHVACLDTLDRIQALTWALGQLAKVEDHCILHPLAIQLLVAMVNQECESIGEIVRPNEGATVR